MMLNLELERAFDLVNQGAEYWRTLLGKYRICSRDYVVVMAAEREDYNYYTLRFLRAFKEEKGADRIFVVHTKDLSSDYIKSNTTVQIEDILCERSEMEALCKLSYLYRFSEQVIFNAFDGICDCDGGLLAKSGYLSVGELVAMSFLGLNECVEMMNDITQQEDLSHHDEEKNVCEQSIGKKICAETEFRRIDWVKMDLLVKTGKSRISSNTDREDMIRERLGRLISDGLISSADKIVLFGVTSSSMLVKEILKGYEIVAFVDNDRRKIGKSVDGIPVYLPEQFLNNYDESIKVIIASRSYHPMCEQIYQYGYEIGKQVFVVYFRHHYFDVLPETVCYFRDECLLGMELYRELTEEGKHSVLCCPYPGTGDIYLIGLYLNEYIKKHCLESYVVVVCSVGCKRVAEMFGYEAKVVSEEDVRKLVAFSRMVGFDKSHMHLLNDSFENSSFLVRLRGYKGIDFNTMFARCVFGMERMIKPMKLNLGSAEELFGKYCLKRGKTVLLSPYANTMHLLSDEFWEQLAAKLIAAGFCVCTNVASPEEKAVEGTAGIFIPYGLVIDFLDMAGYFIALRSGLCDIVSSSTAKLCVLYQKNMMFGGGSLYDYFSLEKMGLRSSGLAELEYDLEDMDCVMSEILGAMI